MWGLAIITIRVRRVHGNVETRKYQVVSEITEISFNYLLLDTPRLMKRQLQTTAMRNKLY